MLPQRQVLRVHRLPPANAGTAGLRLSGGDRKNVRPVVCEIRGNGEEQAKVKKADYNKIATTYDRGRKFQRKAQTCGCSKIK
jgi:hypothetical protein